MAEERPPHYIYEIPYNKRRDLVILLDIERGWEQLAAEFNLSSDDVGMLGLTASRASATDSLLRSLGNENRTITELVHALDRIKKIRAADKIRDLVQPVVSSLGEQGLTDHSQQVVYRRLEHQHQQANRELNLPPKPGPTSYESYENLHKQEGPTNEYLSLPTNTCATNNTQLDYRRTCSHPPPLTQPANHCRPMDSHPQQLRHNGMSPQYVPQTLPNKMNNTSNEMTPEKDTSLPSKVIGSHQQYSLSVNEMPSHPMSLKANPDGFPSDSDWNQNINSCQRFLHQSVRDVGGAMSSRIEGAVGGAPNDQIPKRDQHNNLYLTQKRNPDHTYFNISAQPSLKEESEINKGTLGYAGGSNIPGPIYANQQNQFCSLSQPHEPVESPDYSALTSGHRSGHHATSKVDENTHVSDLSSQMQGVSLASTSSNNVINESLTKDQQLQGVALMHTPSFPFQEIQKATQNFHIRKVIGSGAYGTVYEGNMKQTPFAIKKLRQSDDFGKEKRRQQHHISEIQALTMYRHDNIVQLCGYSMDGPELCLVYQYMVNGSLEDRLACKGDSRPLTCPQRVNIMLGAARGIQYLHSFNKPLIHGDIKSSNILLDKHFEAKIADFGLAKQATSGGDVGKYTHVTLMQGNQQLQGSRPYLPDEFFRNYRLYTKTDTFSFGVVLMEVCTGEMACDEKREGEKLLYEHVRSVVGSGDGERITALHDRRCQDWSRNIYLDLTQLAYKCTENLKRQRPEMGKVCTELEQIDVKMQLNTNAAGKNASLPAGGAGYLGDARALSLHPQHHFMPSLPPHHSVHSFHLAHHSHGDHQGASLHAGVPVSMATTDSYDMSHKETLASDGSLKMMKMEDLRRDAKAQQTITEVPDINIIPATGDFSLVKGTTDVDKLGECGNKEVPSYEDPKYLLCDESKLQKLNVNEPNEDKEEVQYASDPVKLAKIEGRCDETRQEHHISPLQLQQEYDMKKALCNGSEKKEELKTDDQKQCEPRQAEVKGIDQNEGQITRSCEDGEVDLYSAGKPLDNDIPEESERDAISKAFQEKKVFSWMENIYDSEEQG